MTTLRADELLAAIRSLPPHDRLRLVEQVIHDAAETQALAPPQGAIGLLGLFGSDADALALDEAVEDAMKSRERDGLRAP